MHKNPIKELRTWWDHYFPTLMGIVADEFEDIVSRIERTIPNNAEAKQVKAVEPLEELAKRKGEVMTIEFVRRGWAPNMRMSTDEARQYLEGLPDKGEKK